VSQQLRRLQQPIAVPLTRKQGRALRLTEAGAVLAAAGADLEAAMARAQDAVRRVTQAPLGTVTVSAFTSAAMAFFPPLSAAFPRDGDVRVALADEDVAQADFPPLTSRYDLVLAHRFAHTAAWPDTVRVTALLTEPLDVALPVGHPLAARRVVTAAQAVTQPWITTHAGFPVGATIDALAAVTGRAVDIVHRVNEFTIAAELVRAGAGLALIPRWTIPAPPGVVLRPLAGVRSARRIDVLARPENTVRPAVQLVLSALRRTAAGLVAP
jgi:DNA-binding transcriptional LysR family regulator